MHGLKKYLKYHLKLKYIMINQRKAIKFFRNFLLEKNIVEDFNKCYKEYAFAKDPINLFLRKSNPSNFVLSSFDWAESSKKVDTKEKHDWNDIHVQWAEKLNKLQN